jgi:astacin
MKYLARRHSNWAVAVVGIGLSCHATAQVAVPEVGSIEIDGRLITYEIRGGYALYQGDIILGTAEEVQAAARARREGKAGPRESSITILSPTASPSPWPDATMYYTIDSDIPNQQRILDGIQHWNDRTSMKILPRTDERSYVRFQRNRSLDAACSSALGMRGGEQTVQTTDACSTGSVIHELGHAWGLLHEQERNDRNRYVTVLFQNIDTRFVSNFAQGGRDLSYYDYGSIMHYGSTGFTRNGLDSMETVPVGIPIGQRTGLSAGDIDAIHRQYGFRPSATVVTTVPEGLRIVVDGTPVVSPRSFDWAEGSTHTIEAASPQGADPRYVFARWSDGGAASHTITVSADQTVFCAAFQRRYGLTVGVASGAGTAAVKPKSADNFYPDRHPVNVTATPQGTNEFVRWTGTTNLQSNGYSVSAGSANLQVGLANSQFMANFVSASTALTTIDSKPRGRTIVIDGTSYLTPVRLAWPPGTNHTLSLTAAQTSGNNTVHYDFTDWSDGTTENTRTVTAGASAATYTANFTISYLLTVSTLGTGTVTTTPSSASGYYPADSSVQLAATPGSGLTLRYWLGDLAGGDLNPTVKMDGQKTITAYFASAVPFRIFNAASYLANPRLNATGTVVAPGALVVIFGTNIGPPSLVTGQAGSDGNLPVSLGGTRVLFDGIPAPIVYTSQNQASAVVPYALTGKTSTTVGVELNGTSRGSLNISVGPTTPALLTSDSSGKGQVAAFNQDGSINSTTVPAAPGSVVVLYATGAGALTEVVPDGRIMGSRLIGPIAPVFVRVGKLDAEVLYAGSAPGLVNGVLQVNAKVPAEALPDLATPIQLIVGNLASPPGTTIAVQ